MNADAIAMALERIGRPAAFAARARLQKNALSITVRGAGPIRLPVSAAAARRVRAVARPARHGYRNETRIDTSVRDTWEIAKSRVKIDRRRWNSALRPKLEELGRALGLSDDQALRADLHNMLLYEPGQFFAPHQDTEKHPGMVATLVVILPSKSQGGTLIVEHHGERSSFRASKEGLTLVAFYADCHHEVKPLKSGHRIVLTFNVSVVGTGKKPSVEQDTRTVATLRQAVESYFAARDNTPVRRTRERLVYLLDHQYSQQGLRWDRLKRIDAARAAALREVATQLDYEVVLAQADVHEVWSCIDTYSSSYGFRPNSYWLPEEEEEEDYMVSDLIDSDILIRHFVDTANVVQAASDRARDAEIIFTKPSDELDPFETQHEPYMGNWGDTLEKWYHRAAVVLWPRSYTFRIRARASGKWALEQIEDSIRNERLGEAERQVEEILPFWSRRYFLEATPAMATAILRIGAALSRADLAFELAKEIRFEHTGVQAMRAFNVAMRAHGLTWAIDCLDAWDDVSGLHEPHNRSKWLRKLPRLVEVLQESGETAGGKLADALLLAQWTWLQAQHEECQPLSPSYQLTCYATLDRPTLSLLASSQRCPNGSEVGKELLGLLTSNSVPLLAQVSLLKRAHKDLQRGDLQATGLEGLHAHAMDRISRQLKARPRAASDWSIATPLACDCDLCAHLGSFLAADDQRDLEWPIAKPDRKHIHDIIDRQELPVRHETRRTGRPYTLVLRKTRQLFDRDRSTRTRLRRAQQWLKQNGGAFRASRGSAAHPNET